jgi:hypothetical protein
MFKFFRLFKKKLHTPRDSLTYIIPAKAVQDTQRILAEYGIMSPPNEGLVYWGGIENENWRIVALVFAPLTESNGGRVSTSKRSNFDFVRVLSRNNLIQIGQVHSHPTKWVDHSPGDDALAAFKKEGLLSIVVPEYCQNGLKLRTSCGVHRYRRASFIRLSRKYIEGHFIISDNHDSLLEDFRK